MQVLEKILQEIVELEKEHPYKIFGFPDTYDKYNEAWQDCLDRVENIIRSHMEDEHVSNPYKLDDKWIPVEEQLPKEGEYVIVWYEYFRYGDYNRMFQTYGIGYQFDGYWSGDVSGRKARCIAWQPLPAPYQSNEEKGR